MGSVAETVDMLTEFLNGAGLRPCRTEADLHDAIEALLREAALPVRREVDLGEGDRIDLVVAGWLGIEIKTDGTKKEVLRQVLRYAHNPTLDAVILVTTRKGHDLPATLNGKPIRVVWVAPW